VLHAIGCCRPSADAIAGADAVEGDMHDVERLRQAQHFTQEMALRPHAAPMCKCISGIGFDQRDELAEIARRQRGIDGEHVRCGDRARDRGEVLVGGRTAIWRKSVGFTT